MPLADWSTTRERPRAARTHTRHFLSDWWLIKEKVHGTDIR